MADTVTLSYTDAGQGTPVVLLHGFPLERRHLARTAWRQLGERYRVITPDLRAHGRSPATSGVYDMDLLAGDVLALLDALAIQKAVIMGHSMGGYVALAALKVAPERFLALGLIDSQAGADTEEGRQGRYQMAEKVAAEGSKVVAEAMIPKLFAATLPAGAPIVEQVRQMILNTQPAGIIGTLKGMAVRPDSSTLLPNLRIPVLLLTGDEDQIIPQEKAKVMAAANGTASADDSCQCRSHADVGAARGDNHGHQNFFVCRPRMRILTDSSSAQLGQNAACSTGGCRRQTNLRPGGDTSNVPNCCDRRPRRCRRDPARHRRGDRQGVLRGNFATDFQFGDARGYGRRGQLAGGLVRARPGPSSGHRGGGSELSGGEGARRDRGGYSHCGMKKLPGLAVSHSRH